MLLQTLLVALHSRRLPVIYTHLNSGHVHVQLLTDPAQSIQSLPQTLANSFNLIEDGAPLSHAIQQVDMWLKPEPTNIQSLADLASGSSIVYCPTSFTYVIVTYGMFSLYVDETGNTFTCWSQKNERNRNT